MVILKLIGILHSYQHRSTTRAVNSLLVRKRTPAAFRMVVLTLQRQLIQVVNVVRLPIVQA